MRDPLAILANISGVISYPPTGISKPAYSTARTATEVGVEPKLITALV